MTPEELMKPRYKVIADYPDNKNKIGDIIPMKHAGTAAACDLVCGWYDRFPSIYKRLEWWEERSPEDMPEYIKVMSKGMLCNAVVGGVYKVHKHFSSSYGEPNKKGTQIFGDDYLSYSRTVPATETEYNEYLKQKEANNG